MKFSTLLSLVPIERRAASNSFRTYCVTLPGCLIEPLHIHLSRLIVNRLMDDAGADRSTLSTEALIELDQLVITDEAGDLNLILQTRTREELFMLIRQLMGNLDSAPANLFPDHSNRMVFRDLVRFHNALSKAAEVKPFALFGVQFRGISKA